jgi:hypothetical protein
VARLQVLHDVEDLRLHRDVERRGRLVADQELGLGRERARDRDALPLPARELVRELLGVRAREADRDQQLADAIGDALLAALPSPAAKPCSRSGSATMSFTFQRGLRLAYGSWKIICMRRRIDAGRCPPALATTPSKTTLPRVGA